MNEYSFEPIKNSSDSPPPRFKIILSQLMACQAKNFMLMGVAMALNFPTTVVPKLLHAKEGLTMNATTASWYGSIGFIFQILGSFSSGNFLDRFGRRKGIFIACIPHCVAWLLAYWSPNLVVLFFSNVLLGFGTGFMESPCLTYVAEISETSLRGVLLSLSSVFASLGLFLVFFMLNIFSWNYIALVCLSITVATMGWAFVIPETPIWLMNEGKMKKSLKSLCWLRGWSKPIHVQEEFTKLQEYNHKLNTCIYCQYENNETTNIHCLHRRSKALSIKERMNKMFQLICRRETMKPFVMVMFLFLISATNGFLAIKPNLINVCAAFGMNRDPYQITAGCGLAVLFGTTVCICFVKIFGRRKLIILSTLSCAIFNFLLGAYALVKLPSDVSSYGKIETNMNLIKSDIPMYLMVGLFVSAFTGNMPLPWSYMSEVFPFRTRAVVIGILTGIVYLMNFIFSKTFINFESTFSLGGTFLVYAAFGLSGSLAMYLYLPETENVSLQDIEKFFARKATVVIVADDIFYNCLRGKKSNIEDIHNKNTLEINNL